MQLCGDDLSQEDERTLLFFDSFCDGSFFRDIGNHTNQTSNRLPQFVQRE